MGGSVTDAAFANFMQRVDQLAIGGYGAEPSPAGTRSLLRVDYLDEAGEEVGFVELFHDELSERDPYYIRSETTRIVAYAVTSLAERVEQGSGRSSELACAGRKHPLQSQGYGFGHYRSSICGNNSGGRHGAFVAN